MDLSTILYGIGLAIWILMPALVVLFYRVPDDKTMREARVLVMVLQKYAEEHESMKALLDARARDMDEQVIELSNTARRLREAMFAAKFD